MGITKYRLIEIVSEIVGIIFLICLISLGFFAENWSMLKETMVFKAFLIVFVIAFIYITAFVIWSVKSINGKKYWRECNRRNKEKNNKENMSEIDGTKYYGKLNIYEGKNAFGINRTFVRVFLVYGIFIISIAFTVALIYALNGYISMEAVYLQGTVVAWICFIIFGIRNLFKKVIIDDGGVKLKSLFEEQTLPWSKIKTIGISVSPTGRRIPWGYLYFSTRQIKDSICIQQRYEKKHIIMLKIRPKLVHCVLQYWDKEIINLSNNKSWRRYLHKNGISKSNEEMEQF